MAITIISQQITLASTGPTTTVAMPAGLANGDVVLVFIRDQLQTSSADFTPADGFARIGVPFVANATDGRISGTYARRVTDAATFPTSTSWYRPGADSRRVFIAVALRGVDPATLVRAYSATYGGTTAAAYTGAAVGDLTLLWSHREVVSPNATWPTSLPSGFTPLAQASAPSDSTTVSRTTGWLGSMAATGSAVPAATVTWPVAVGQGTHMLTIAAAAEVIPDPKPLGVRIGTIDGADAYLSIINSAGVRVAPASVTAVAATTTTPSEGLWFALPETRTSPKKVFAHYFGPYPRSIGDSTTMAADNYSTYFNNPNYSPYATTGGMFRDRPLWREKIGTGFKLIDAKWDIQQAKAAGIDGFAPDLLGLSGTNYDNYETLRQAAIETNAGGGQPFYIVPMVDANGATAAAGAKAAAGYVKRFCIGDGTAGATPISSAYFLPDGRYLFSAFKGEGQTLQYWTDVIGYLQSDWGINAAFMPCYVNYNQAANYTSIQYGSGAWGYGADPAVIRAATNQAATARARGEVHFAPVAAQDIRPATANGHWFDEALNTGSQRAAWDKAIAENSEYVQLVTWSDYSETPMAPSTANGWTMLDINAWYISRWKTGAFPAILRDGIILSHRARTLGHVTTGPQTSTLPQNNRGSQSTVTNNIEVLTFLPTSATVEVTIGGTVQTYTAPAGMGVQTYPVPGALAAGAITARVIRSGATSTTVTSPIAIKSSAINDDWGYYRMSSIRGTAGQWDPSTAY